MSSDLTGRTFDKLTVIGPAFSKHKSSRKWMCQCECGTYKEYTENYLLYSKAVNKSCGCTRKLTNDLSNKKFGRLTVLKPTKQRFYNYIVYLCRCDCGNYKLAPMHNLLNGNLVSCGCKCQELNNQFGENVIKWRKDGTWHSGKSTKCRHYKRVEGIDI